jgi:hypothetical protein
VSAVLLGAALGAAIAWGRVVAAPRHARRASFQGEPARVSERAGPSRLAEAERQCLARQAELAALPALSLPPSSEPELRAQLFGRTKSAPVLFLARPLANETERAAVALRALLEASPGYETFGTVVGKVRKDPALARAVFLRDGYLYTENPELAALLGSLTLSLLFRDQELRIVRGSEELFARRLQDGDYEYTSGDERGRRAKLYLFDRISSAVDRLGAAAHVDLRELSRELGFDELSIRRATAEYLAVDAVYGDVRVPTLLQLAAGKASLACEAPGAHREQVLAHRAQAARATLAQARLVSVVKEQVEEGLPFDEPKTEDGQQDGKLRPEWRAAYLNGSASFEFNGDRYAVFDETGRPRPPQVCIDFVLDTFERAGGTWWKPRGEPRERARGRLTFDDTGMANRRSVERFVEFARAHAEAFDVYDPPAEERVPLRNRAQFFATLYRARAQFRRGDIVAILGPRDDEKLHYHSFIIVAADPLSGMPTELAANAGRPRIRSWEGEMSNAPRRSIFSRVRPRQPWLESFLSLEGRGFGPADRQTDVSADQARPALVPDAKRPAAG